MKEREDILDEIVSYYRESPDFNGLPIYSMKHHNNDVLSSLVDEGLVLVLSGKEVANPHIKALNYNIPIETQKRNISAPASYAVLYPTAKALAQIDADLTRPYTALLEKGHAQLEIIYFSVEILERYANNPQFRIIDFGYRGSIWPKDENEGDESLDNEYIRDYGMAYVDRPELERANGVFIRDLSNLSSQKQMLWKGFEINSKVKCKIHEGFYRNLILGEWVTDFWIFTPFLRK
ncbi:MAG: hypothetical protein PHP02_03635 [Eubacteriales bacterium]|nr:hypothetical protein [Eubacteriales bacterium]